MEEVNYISIAWEKKFNENAIFFISFFIISFKDKQLTKNICIHFWYQNKALSILTKSMYNMFGETTKQYYAKDCWNEKTNSLEFKRIYGQKDLGTQIVAKC